jgi:hypothetical protein
MQYADDGHACMPIRHTIIRWPTALLLLLTQVILNDCHDGSPSQMFAYKYASGALRWKGEQQRGMSATSLQSADLTFIERE